MTDETASEQQERLRQVFRDYPWLWPMLRDAEKWQYEDGGGGFCVEFDDHAGKREGFQAFAAALGVRFEEYPPAELTYGPSRALRVTGPGLIQARPVER